MSLCWFWKGKINFMKNITILFFLTFSISLCAQNDSILKISDSTFISNFDSVYNSLLEKENPVFYEDSLYSVRKTCSGEWGGSVWFKNKKTGVGYSCESTCPLSINRIKNKYYVTSNLNHGFGLTKIIEIENPEKMEIFQEPKPIKQKSWKWWKKKDKIYYVGAFESKSIKGTNLIFDSVGIEILGTTKIQDTIYQIIQDRNSIFLSTVIEGKLIPIQNLNFLNGLNFTKLMHTIDKKIILFFENSDSEGYVEIFNKNISISRFNKG